MDKTVFATIKIHSVKTVVHLLVFVSIIMTFSAHTVANTNISEMELYNQNQALTDQNLNINYLRHGQIRFLYVWVHPAWRRLNNEDFERHSKFIRILASRPETALIEIPWGYGSGELSGPFEGSKLRSDLKYLFQLNLSARMQLGPRFILWPDSKRYINGEDSKDLQKIVDQFHLTPSIDFGYFKITDPKHFLTRNFPKLLTSIHVYGEDPEMCAAFQANESNLFKLAHSVTQSPTSFPIFATFGPNSIPGYYVLSSDHDSEIEKSTDRLISWSTGFPSHMLELISVLGKSSHRSISCLENYVVF